MEKIIVGEAKKAHLIVDCKNLINLNEDIEKRISDMQLRKEYYVQIGFDVDETIKKFQQFVQDNTQLLEIEKSQLKSEFNFNFDEVFSE